MLCEWDLNDTQLQIKMNSINSDCYYVIVSKNKNKNKNHESRYTVSLSYEKLVFMCYLKFVTFD